MAGYVNSSKHKILTREEEIVLGKAVVAGQQAAKKLNECFIEGIQLEFVERRSLNAAVKEGKRAKDHFVDSRIQRRTLVHRAGWSMKISFRKPR